MIHPSLVEKSIPPDIHFTWEQIAPRVNGHTLAVQLWLDTRSPKASRYDGLGVSCGSTGIQIPLLNQALGANYPQDCPSGDIENEIQAVRSFFEDRGVPYYWWLSPFYQPEDMPALLEKKGMLGYDEPLPAMVAFLNEKSTYRIDSDIKVWKAEEMEDLKAASFIRHAGFQFPDGVGLDYFEAMPDSWLDPDGPAYLYLAAFGDGPPAAIGALIYGADMPGVYVMATLPEWQQKGLGKAILARILHRAAEQKNDGIIGLTASRFGYGLYQQFGFQHIFDYRIYYLPETNKIRTSE
jgi:GNAT superfamily N-acetyltransferase